MEGFSADDLKPCSVVYIASSYSAFLEKIIPVAHEASVLTISSIEGFANAGGIFGLFRLGNVVKFDVNLKRARLCDIEIGSRLLELAHEVIR